MASEMMFPGGVFRALGLQEDGSDHTIHIQFLQYEKVDGKINGAILDNDKKIPNTHRTVNLKLFSREIVDSRNWTFERRKLGEDEDTPTQIWTGLPEFLPLVEELQKDDPSIVSWDLRNRYYIFMRLQEEPSKHPARTHYACRVIDTQLLLTLFTRYSGATQLIKFWIEASESTAESDEDNADSSDNSTS